MENKMRNSLKAMRDREKQPRKIASTKLEELCNYKPHFPFLHQRIVLICFWAWRKFGLLQEPIVWDSFTVRIMQTFTECTKLCSKSC